MIFRRSNRWRYGLAAAGGIAVLTAATATPAHAAKPHWHNLAGQLQEAMIAQNFGDVLDATPPGTPQARLAHLPSPLLEVDGGRHVPALNPAAAKPIHQPPQVDATVIELNGRGQPVASGTVMMSPRYKDGVIVPVDRNFHTDKVRYRLWNTDEWDTKGGQGSVDTIPGREHAPIDYMTPYPASIVKLMVGFGIMQQVDEGTIKLDDPYAYQPTPVSDRCGGPAKGTIRSYFDRMITVSDNGAACALIKVLHAHNAVDGLNRTFQNLGLEGLQLKGTNPTNGDWSPQVTMPSLDTAKLLVLINGPRGRAWTAPDGKPVTGNVLSDSSRAFFKKELTEQGWNNVLSTTNYCGYPYPAKGIPQLTQKRWIGKDGTVDLSPEPDGKYQYPIQPCQDEAEVTFAHKTGLTAVAAGDAGIVKSLPGEQDRYYVIVALSNLGWRYLDRDYQKVNPSVNRTEKFALLGKAMDDYEADQ